MGKREEALRYLARSFELGYWEVELLDNPDLAGLSGDPEFEALLATRTGRNRLSN